MRELSLFSLFLLGLSTGVSIWHTCRGKSVDSVRSVSCREGLRGILIAFNSV
jgi:hypothetical protein